MRAAIARVVFVCLTVSLLACLAGCGAPETPYVWNLPMGFPEPTVPANNPMTAQKVELGRHLFYDKRLSGNQTQACAGCHPQALAFADDKVTPSGSTGELLARNSMSLVNVAFNQSYTWANPVLDTLEKQVLVPMFGERPVELGMTNRIDEILGRLRGELLYQELFGAAFPKDGDPVSVEHIVEALTCFARTLISGNSAYDRYVYQGQEDALSPAARQGFDLFFSEKFECYHCHSGINFTASFTSKKSRFTEGDAFHNTGLYNLNGRGDYPSGNRGLFEATQAPVDMGRFRVPTLRNIELTAPYMHDGSIGTLEEVIDHYAAGGRTIASGSNAGVGSASPYKNPLVRGFTASAEERAALIAFLRSLTDVEFTRDARFADPFK